MKFIKLWYACLSEKWPKNAIFLTCVFYAGMPGFHRPRQNFALMSL